MLQEAGKASPAFSALLRVVEVLETDPGAVVLLVDELLSTQEPGEPLGVSRMTVVRLIRKGELVAVGGGVWRLLRSRAIDTAATKRRRALQGLTHKIRDDPPLDQVIRTR